MERNMALIGFAQPDTNNKYIFLTQQVHKETWVGLAVKLWGSISRAGVNSRVKHSRARKYQHKHDFFLRFHLLNSRLFVGGLFMSRTGNTFRFKG
jgi:hypothetical protein